MIAHQFERPGNGSRAAGYRLVRFN